jgi:hypothetical protein
MLLRQHLSFSAEAREASDVPLATASSTMAKAWSMLVAPSWRSDGLADQIESAIESLSARGYIQFHPALAQSLDNFKAALFLGHALYWTRHLARHNRHRDGWFFMTARDWEKATGLSQREQVSVRALLQSQGLLDEALVGKPAQLHFRVNLPGLALCISKANPLGVPLPSDNRLNLEALSPWLASSVQFFKPLADVVGNTAAGLYMSWLLQQHRRQLVTQSARPTRALPAGATPIPGASMGYVLVNLDDVRIALCLGPKTQRNAREKLKAAGFIQEVRASGDRTGQRLIHVKVNLTALLACLSAQDARPLPVRKATPATRPPAVPVSESVVATATQVLIASNESEQPGAPLIASGSKRKDRQIPLFGPMGLQAGAVQGSEQEGTTASLLLNGGTARQPETRLMAAAQLFGQGHALLTGHAVHTATPTRTQRDERGDSFQSDTPSVAVERQNIKPENPVSDDAVLSKLDGQNAVLSKLDVPFCRNYIQVVFKTNTTTTDTFSLPREADPADNFPVSAKTPVRVTPSRRRAIHIVSNPKPAKQPEAAHGLFAEIEAEAEIQPDERDSVAGQAVGAHRTSNHLETRQIQAPIQQPEPAKPATPDALPPQSKAGVVVAGAEAIEYKNLILPVSLAKDWHPGVLHALQQVQPTDRQALLDELAGQMESTAKSIHNPAGWMHGLAKRFVQGGVVLAMAETVAAERARRQYVQNHIDAASRGATLTGSGTTVPTAPVLTEANGEDAEAIKRNALERLRALRASYVNDKAGV